MFRIFLFRADSAEDSIEKDVIFEDHFLRFKNFTLFLTELLFCKLEYFLQFFLRAGTGSRKAFDLLFHFIVRNSTYKDQRLMFPEMIHGTDDNPRRRRNAFKSYFFFCQFLLHILPPVPPRFHYSTGSPKPL